MISSVTTKLDVANVAGCETRHGQTYAVQTTNFVQFISLDRWVERALRVSPQSQVSAKKLYEAYTYWVECHEDWDSSVIPTQFF